MLTEFNEGGSHEQNPLGGIPQGMNNNGQMNTVEENETKKGNFIYSDRLYINEDLVKQMNLPNYIKGKSFANASKTINDKFKDRNDIHTKATQKELLDRLAQSQEQLKAEQEAINKSMQVNQAEMQYPEETAQFEGGGFMDFISNNGSSIGNMGFQLGSMINPNGYNGEDITKSANAGYENKHLQNADKYSQGLEMIQSEFAKSYGPIGEAAFGAKKLGENIGGAIGGDTGAGIKSFFSPEKSAIANWTDKDMKFGDKLLGHLPVISGIKAKQSADKKLQTFKDTQNRVNNFYKYQFNENNDDTKVFAKGGFLKGGNLQDTFPNGIYQPLSDKDYLLYNKNNYNKNIVKNIQSNIGAKTDGIPGKETYVKSGLRYDGTNYPINLNADKALESALATPDSEIKQDYTLDDIKNIEANYNTTIKNKKPFDFKQISDKFGNALRYAPVLSNIIQKNNIGPAEVESAIKNPYQYKQQYIDESQYRNAADQQSALTMEALNKSGLSGNQLMAASLGSQLQRTKGVAEGAMAAKMNNINEDKIAEQVKQQNEADFVNDQRRINDINAMNRANRDTQMSKFDAEIANSLGAIGKEETFKKMAEKMTGYDWMGKYLKANPNATPSEAKEAYDKEKKLEKEKEATTYKKGGMMNLKFNKY